MMSSDFAFDEDQALERLMRFLSVEGITGQEKAIGEEVVKAVEEAGVPPTNIQFDRAHKQIPLPTQTGNLIVKLPGNIPGDRLLFMTHLDTVPLCAGARPVRKKGRIVPEGKTALGGDNRTGVGVLVTLLTTLVQKKLPHPPITFLFTVREESGLWGARFVDAADLEHPAMGFNVDGSHPTELTIGATGAERWHVEITGRASHAGAHPEQGISATMVASLAMAEVYNKGWFGKVKKGKREGTSNVGSVGGPGGTSAGQATNVVTDYVLIHGESRSHDTKFVQEITRAYKDAFVKAAKQVSDHKGRRAKIRFEKRRDYYSFRLKPTTPVVAHATAAAERVGLKPTLRITNGGLDANWLVRNGIPTLTFGAGQRQVHTIEEHVELEDYLNGCRMALALATQE